MYLYRCLLYYVITISIIFYYINASKAIDTSVLHINTILDMQVVLFTGKRSRNIIRRKS